MRFKLVLEYQGTRYSGWQMQKNARTVQGEIRDALAKIVGHSNFELYGAGRTDAGVHALGQVAHLEIGNPAQPAERLHRLVGEKLPSDIHILSFKRVDAAFHARHHAVSRSYLYQVSRRKSAFGKKLVWWVKDELDVAEMRRTAKLFAGMKDFKSFSADEPEDKSTKVLLERVQIAESGALVLIRIEGSHFLWKMVRRVVGVLVERGKGKLTETDVERFLQTKSDEPARLAAPASGLFLEKVYYPGEERLAELRPVIWIG
jgi:tRNA pseudouridine38-40 synthase